MLQNWKSGMTFSVKTRIFEKVWLFFPLNRNQSGGFFWQEVFARNDLPFKKFRRTLNHHRAAKDHFRGGVTENSTLAWIGLLRPFWWLKLWFYENRGTYPWSTEWALQVYRTENFKLCLYRTKDEHFLGQLTLFSRFFTLKNPYLRKESR